MKSLSPLDATTRSLSYRLLDKAMVWLFRNPPHLARKAKMVAFLSKHFNPDSVEKMLPALKILYPHWWDPAVANPYGHPQLHLDPDSPASREDTIRQLAKDIIERISTHMLADFMAPMTQPLEDFSQSFSLMDEASQLHLADIQSSQKSTQILTLHAGAFEYIPSLFRHAGLQSYSFVQPVEQATVKTLISLHRHGRHSQSAFFGDTSGIKAITKALRKGKVSLTAVFDIRARGKQAPAINIEIYGRTHCYTYTAFNLAKRNNMQLYWVDTFYTTNGTCFRIQPYPASAMEDEVAFAKCSRQFLKSYYQLSPFSYSFAMLGKLRKPRKDIPTLTESDQLLAPERGGKDSNHRKKFKSA